MLCEKHFLWRWYCDNKQIKMWFIVICTLMDNEYSSSLFSQKLLSYGFCMLSEFAEVFDRKVWHVQVAHLHNAVCALSFLSWCVLLIILSTNLDKDFFRYLWYCGKITNRMWFSLLCTLMDNNMCHHSGQNLLWTCESTTFWPLWWLVSLSIRVQTMLKVHLTQKYFFRLNKSLHLF